MIFFTVIIENIKQNAGTSKLVEIIVNSPCTISFVWSSHGHARSLLSWNPRTEYEVAVPLPLNTAPSFTCIPIVTATAYSTVISKLNFPAAKKS